ncbi:MAG: GNAT family N-acetyltransferase [Pseudomonadota bacterium]
MQQLQYSSHPPTAAEFKSLYDTAGWGPVALEPAFYGDALSGTWRVRCAYCGTMLVGVIRIISDGRLHAFITEMIVHPDFQGQGVGSSLLVRALEACRDAGVTDIQLFCARGKAAFYGRHGFEPRPQDAPGMQYMGPGAISSNQLPFQEKA